MTLSVYHGFTQFLPSTSTESNAPNGSRAPGVGLYPATVLQVRSQKNTPTPQQKTVKTGDFLHVCLILVSLWGVLKSCVHLGDLFKLGRWDSFLTRYKLLQKKEWVVRNHTNCLSVFFVGGLFLPIMFVSKDSKHTKRTTIYHVIKSALMQ